MTRPAYTAGPWEVREASPNWEIFGEDRSRWVAYAPKAVADEHRDGTFYPSLSETAANAHLIAAAPTMLEVLKVVCAILDTHRNSDGDLPAFEDPCELANDLEKAGAHELITAAIAKAGGQS